eukprot:3218182-Pyramimonas_sp.AAC.1
MDSDNRVRRAKLPRSTPTRGPFSHGRLRILQARPRKARRVTRPLPPLVRRRARHRPRLPRPREDGGRTRVYAPTCG